MLYPPNIKVLIIISSHTRLVETIKMVTTLRGTFIADSAVRYVTRCCLLVLLFQSTSVLCLTYILLVVFYNII